MVYFAGYVFGTMIIPTLSDLYGRKLIYLSSHIVNQVCVLVILLLPSELEVYYNVAVALACVIGITAAGRQNIGFCYMSEFVPASGYNWLGTCFGTQRCFLAAIFAGYFRFISKDWRYL